MRVSTSWIKNSLRRTMSDRELADTLETAGIEVEQLISSTAIDKNIVVGLVTKCVQHPNADRLKITEVEIAGKTLSIVCGAPNVRAGLKVAVAQVGATLPSGDVITRAKLRGEVSEGMLCSGRELALSDDHQGLIELDSGLKTGTKLSDLYPADGQLEIKTAANRFDLQSVLGLAREVAALSTNELKPLGLTPTVATEQGPAVKVDVTPLQAGRFMLAELTLAKPNTGTNAKRAAWLRSSGVRTISPLVDATNYVMLEHGQPLHAYDADKVKGAIVVRMAKAGEKIVTLDGVERKLTAEDLVIADDRGAIGLAGVMGGAATEVDAQTKRIYLEVATFHGATVRKMAKRHSLRSEASARFERGLPVKLAPLAMAGAVELLKKELGAKVVGVTDELRVWPWEQHIGLRMSQLNRLLGITLKPKETTEALSKLGIEAEPFDIVAEAKRHLGKPYVWGASYKKNGADAFDCSYFTDYLYSLIGQRVGHTTLAQYEIGQPIDEADLKPGDNLFYEGKAFEGDHAYDLKAITKGEQPHSTIGHYFLWDQQSQKYIKTVAKTKRLVGHNGLYIGDGKVIHAATYRWNGKDWEKLAKPGVVISSVSEFTSNPGYLGARRYVDDLGDFITAAHIPWWRPDLRLPEDLIEEVVRVIGYDRIPSTLPAWQPRELSFDRERAWRRRLREVLFGAGLFEVMTYSFVSEEQLRELGSEPKHHLKLSNPLSVEQAYLRRSPLPSLLATLARNAKYAPEVGLYEVTGVFEPKAKGKLPDEPERLAVIWRSKAQAYAQIKGILDRLNTTLSLDLEVVATTDGRFANGRGGEVHLGDKTIGWIGQLKPALVQRHKLSGEVAYLELGLEPVLVAAHPTTYRPPSRFPAARRDLAVVVAESVTWQQLHDEAAHDGLAEVSFVSDYRGDDLPAGHKSVALRLEMSAPDHTLNEAEVDDRLKVIETRLKRKLGAVPRS